MSIKSLQEVIQQTQYVYRHYIFLVVNYLSEGIPEIAGSDREPEIISEEVPRSLNIDNLLRMYPEKFKYDDLSKTLIYKDSMDEEEYVNYKSLLASSRELEALRAIYERSQIGNVYYNGDILEGADIYQYLDKSKCTTPEAAAEELDRADSQAMKHLQELRRKYEEEDERTQPAQQKIYDIRHTQSGDWLVSEFAILPKRVKMWCQRLGMPYIFEDIPDRNQKQD